MCYRQPGNTDYPYSIKQLYYSKNHDDVQGQWQSKVHREHRFSFFTQLTSDLCVPGDWKDLFSEVNVL